MRLLALGLLAILGSGLFSQSADSRFEIFLRKSDNSPQTGSTVSIKNLGTMTDYALSEVVGSPGLYRRDDVPVGMYAVYVNSVLKTTNRFHPTNQIALTLAQIDPDKNYMIDTQGLETGAVTTDKILDSTIMKIDLDTSLTTWIINNAGGGGGGSGYQPDGVTIVFTLPDSTLSVANLGITTGKLAADAVTSAKISDGTITTLDIANGTISTADLGFTLTGDGLYIDEFNILHVQGDGSTIGVVSDQLQILANAIDSSKVINRSLDTLDFKWGHIVLSPGDGLGGAEKLRFGVSNTIYVNPDNTGITISGDAVALKDGGVYPEKVNALVAGLGLGKPNAESGIQINAGDGLFIENDTLKVNASGVINAGLGLSQDGNDFNVNTKEGVVISADTVQLNPSIGGIGLSYDAGVLNVKAGHGVQISSDTVRINPAVAGKGLKWKGDSLDINVTNKSLIISSDTLKVNSDIAGAGLGYSAETLRAQVNRGLTIENDSIGISEETKSKLSRTYIPCGIYSIDEFTSGILRPLNMVGFDFILQLRDARLTAFSVETLVTQDTTGHEYLLYFGLNPSPTELDTLLQVGNGLRQYIYISDPPLFEAGHHWDVQISSSIGLVGVFVILELTEE